MDRNKGRFQSHSRPHPRGLKGREIGLFYKKRAMEAKKDRAPEMHKGVDISLSRDTIREIERLLNENADNKATTECCMEFQKQFLSTLSTSFEDFLKSNLGKSGKIPRDESLDGIYFRKFEVIKNSDKYKAILRDRCKLPVFGKREEILNSIFENQIILISGDTGCGKTTQVPQFILDYHIENKMSSVCNVICTQPRRISAITVAERVAWERTEKLGDAVGYQIRLQGVRPRDHGFINYCTTGILLRLMETDPLLNGFSYIIIDEIHERAVETDILLGLLKQIIQYRKDLKIILMSATFNTETFSNYYDSCPIIHIHGTLFPVEELYLEDVLKETKFRNFPAPRKPKQWHAFVPKYKDKFRRQESFESYIAPYARCLDSKYPSWVVDGIQNPASEEINIELIKDLIFHIHLHKPDGAILVFLPGYDKISKLNTEIIRSKLYQSRKFQLFPLHSMMPTVEQKAIFQRPPPGVRKVILSTNIAETSITIDDVVYVINSGKMKLTDLDIERNLQTLEEQWVTIANSKQRKGRAGRVQRGICYHLYSRARENLLDQFPTPDILRTRLASVILSMKMLRIHDVKTFFLGLIDAPQEIAILNSINLLKRINALDECENITPLGLHLARLPIDPQPGKMILMASLFRCIDPITSVAASLSFKEPFHRPLGKEKQVDEIRKKFAGDTRSDHLMLANVIEDLRFAVELHDERSFCYENFLSLTTLNQLERMKGQFCEILEAAKFLESSDPKAESNNLNSLNHKVARAVICAGLYPNIAHIRKIKIRKNHCDPIINMATPEDGKVVFFPSSVNATQRDFDSRFVVYYLKQKSSAVFLFDTTMVHPLPMLIFGDGVHTGVDEYGKEYISLANSFRFQSDKQTSDLILKLRNGIEFLLQKKALHPSPIDMESSDANYIKAITYILTKERHSQYDDSDSD